MHLSDPITPVAAAHGDAPHLGQDDGAPNGSGNLLGALDAQAAVSVVVSHNDKGLEAGALSGAGLLLHGHDLHHLVLEGRTQEVVDDLVLLDGESKQEDLLQGLDLALLDQATELGDGHPLLFAIVLAASSTSTAAIATAAAVTPPAVSAASPESTAEAATLSGWCWCVSHILQE